MNPAVAGTSSSESDASNESEDVADILHPRGRRGASRLGSLNLKPSNFDEYINLPVSDVGRYELVEDILVARPMPNGPHDKAVIFLMSTFWERKRRFHRQSDVHAVPGPVVSIPQTNSDSSDSSPSSVKREPDLAIGVPHCHNIVSFPLNYPPEIVFEITSGNRKTDLRNKKKEYARAGIGMYIIIDRDLPHKGKRNHDPHVEVGKLNENDSRYEMRRYEMDDTLHCRYIGTVSAAQLLDPPNPSQLMIKNAEEEEQALQEANERANKEKKRADKLAVSLANEKASKEKEKERADKLAASLAKETERADREKERADREKRKRKNNARKLKENGIAVSDSSSSSPTGSPVRKMPSSSKRDTRK